MFEQLKDINPGREFFVNHNGRKFGYVISQDPTIDRTKIRIFRLERSAIDITDTYEVTLVNNTIVHFVKGNEGVATLKEMAK